MVKIGKFHLKALKISLYFFVITFGIIILVDLIINIVLGWQFSHFHFTGLLLFALLSSGIIYYLLSRELFVKKQFTNLILEEEKKFQLLFENANDAILLLKEQFIIDCNLKACEIFNCGKYDLIGSSFLELSSNSKNFNTVLELIKKSSSKPQHCEWEYCRSDKLPFFAEVTLNQLNISGFHFIQVTIRDVSELKKSQKAFSQSEEKFKMIFNSVSDGMIIFNDKDEVLEVNQTVLDRYGLTREEFDRLPANMKFPPKLIETINSHLKELEHQDSILFEVENVIARDLVLHLEMRIRMITFEGQKAYVAVARDISRRKIHQMEIYNAVIQAEEMERSRIAKELHDGVSPILSTAKLYAQSLADCTNEELRSNIISKIETTVNESIQSISEISNKLSPHILQNFGLSPAIQSYVDKINDLKKGRINFSANWQGRMEENLEVTLYRVVIELINNSLKHSGAGDIQILINKSRGIRLIYSDNGIGLNIRETLNLKKGMGLFNMINRVQSLHGTIDFFSEPGKGFKAIIVFNEEL